MTITLERKSPRKRNRMTTTRTMPFFEHLADGVKRGVNQVGAIVVRRNFQSAWDGAARC